MAEKGTIFEQIKEKIDELIMGRRYIISEVGKLKVAMDKLQASLPDVTDLDKWLTEVKGAVSSMGQLSTVLNQLADSAGAIQSMNMSMDSVKNTIKGMGDLRLVSENIMTSSTKISGLGESVREVRDSIRGMDSLKEDFAANLGIMGELNISMSGLKGTMDTLSSKFEGLAGLADLGKVAKDLKPAIDDLKTTMGTIGELKETLTDIKKSATTLGDLKLLATELKATMAEFRETSKTIGIATPAASVGLPKTKPIAKPISIKPISSSTTTGPKPISKKPKSKEPLKAGITYKRKKPTTAKPAKGKPAKKKKGKTPPIVLEVFQLIEQRAQRGETAGALSKIIENARDTISKSWKWHPILYEVGTFARKLKKYPPEKPPDTEVINLLMKKMEEWKEKMTDDAKR
ncbi:MAG: hypothetical protein HWN67_08450 [Candidatus Helarchaeota archaeon]|nr:hypothetical protein [Candidatus Helarchaeota archaeon]